MIIWKNIKKVLCIRLDAMGDVLMTTPAFSAIKKHNITNLTLLTSPQGAEIAKFIPNVDKIITYEAPWLKASKSFENSNYDKKIIDSVKFVEFDLAIIFTVFSQSPLPAAFFCYLANIPLRIAFCRENPYHLLTHWFPESEPEKFLRHETQRHLDLVSSLGIDACASPLKLSICEEKKKNIKLLIPQKYAEKMIVFHTGSTAASRRFAKKGFQELALRLATEHGMFPVFTGTADENESIEEITQNLNVPHLNLSGKLNLAELIALISSARVLISNNSGPVHIAAAVGIPVIDLYALTNPQHTPWMIPNYTIYNKTDCAWCYKSVCPEGTNACLKIPINEILDKTCDLLNRFKGPEYDLTATKPIFFKKDFSYAQT